jgi:aspartate/methionine/tyrosine aminotransferase
MRIKKFGVEMYMNEYENDAVYNLSETCVSSMTVNELLDLVGDKEKIIDEILALRLSYGHIEGSDGIKAGICSLYETMKPENVVTAHGAIGANDLVITALVDSGDVVVSVLPTYQQHYSIPESLGADVKIVPLNMENQFLPNLDIIASYMSDKVKLVCLNNPNNPSGSLMDEDYLQKIIEIVRPYGAYILCDEVYRGVNHEGNHMTASMADLYEKGISTCSMSKAFSLAGLRLGWVAGPVEVIKMVNIHRDYTTISCGVIDDYLAALALKNKDKIFKRNIKIVKTNIEILDKWITSEANFSYVRPKGGTTAFIKMEFDMPSFDFCQKLLRETGVMLVPGSAMEMEGFVRMGYAYEPKLLSEGLEKISKFTEELLSLGREE